MPSRPIWDVILPPVYPGHPARSTVRSRSAQWLHLKPELRQAQLVTLPAEQFADERRVPDESSYRIGKEHSIEGTSDAPEAGCVVIALESPHKAEFDADDRAVGPLRHPPSRDVLECYLPTLLADTETWLRGYPGGRDLSLVGRQVILANAVQYQSSLHGLMMDPALKLQTAVRDCVWKMLFAAGGADDFLQRMDGLDPSLVLLAPTSGVRDTLAAALRAFGAHWPWRFIDRHPSCWGMKGPALRGESEYRHYPP